MSLWAILKAGGVFMLLNPTLKTAKLGYCLNDARARVLVTDADKLGRVADDWSALPHLQTVLVAGGTVRRACRRHRCSSASPRPW